MAHRRANTKNLNLIAATLVHPPRLHNCRIKEQPVHAPLLVWHPKKCSAKVLYPAYLGCGSYPGVVSRFPERSSRGRNHIVPEEQAQGMAIDFVLEGRMSMKGF
jgi:hypothetical protein